MAAIHSRDVLLSEEKIKSALIKGDWEKDPVGTVAFAIYKIEEIEFAKNQLNEGKTWTSRDILEYRSYKLPSSDYYKHKAIKMIYAQKSIEDINESVKKLQMLIAAQKKPKSWLYDIFAVELVGAIISTLIMGGLILLLKTGHEGNLSDSVKDNLIPKDSTKNDRAHDNDKKK